MLIASLQMIHLDNAINRIITCPAIGAVRYNTGADSPYSPSETLERLLEMTKDFGKSLWLDLKGRQLRITKWADHDYAKIELNHTIDAEYGARVYFRGEASSNLKFANGNAIYVDPIPPRALGAGQAINIIGDWHTTDGYLTKGDREYISAATKLGISNYMLSFVESMSDIEEFENAVADSSGVEMPQIDGTILKIESRRGIDFIRQRGDYLAYYGLMAARDDLFINIGQNKAEMISATQEILACDPDAIAASRIFSGLERGEVTNADFSDLHLLHLMGYRNFILSDGICQRHFDQAIEAWENYHEWRKGKCSNW